jgi:hypothetical protein
MRHRWVNHNNQLSHGVLQRIHYTVSSDSNGRLQHTIVLGASSYTRWWFYVTNPHRDQGEYSKITRWNNGLNSTQSTYPCVSYFLTWVYKMYLSDTSKPNKRPPWEPAEADRTRAYTAWARRWVPICTKDSHSFILFRLRMPYMFESLVCNLGGGTNSYCYGFTSIRYRGSRCDKAVADMAVWPYFLQTGVGSTAFCFFACMGLK